MTKAVFGQDCVCSCQLGEMTDRDRRRRAKELRDAKKRGEKAPRLVRGVDCDLCGGSGYVKT